MEHSLHFVGKNMHCFHQLHFTLVGKNILVPSTWVVIFLDTLSDSFFEYSHVVALKKPWAHLATCGHFLESTANYR